MFQAVRVGASDRELPSGPTQGPFSIRVPLDEQHPHRATVRLATRCLPRFKVEVRSRRGVEERWLGAEDEAWQGLLKQRQLDLHSEPAVAAPPESGAGLAVRGVVTGDTAAASASVTLPGHWKRVATADEEFEAKLAVRCAHADDWEVTFEPWDAGEREIDVVAWAEVPQWVGRGLLSVIIERLDPPSRELGPKEAPPAAGATWRAGTHTWFHTEASWGWRWTDGEWLAPANVPPPREERVGEPPNLGQVWAAGSWHWAGRAGWEWTRGHWFVPEEPGTPPPLRAETPSGRCENGQWMKGSWAWDRARGWVWHEGQWLALEPSVRPAPRAESPGTPPNLGQAWRAGSWLWKGCSGWEWHGGRWVVPATPGQPPPEREERPEGQCAGGVWQRGHWFWDVARGWAWEHGTWASVQPTEVPPPRPEPHGDAPHVGQEWRGGSWRWQGCEGWGWTPGRWYVPERPVSAPPPPFLEQPPPNGCLAARWRPGLWVWNTTLGWDWRDGSWSLSDDPLWPKPPAQREVAPFAPTPAAAWRDGTWEWHPCEGWQWNSGRWVQPQVTSSPEDFLPLPQVDLRACVTLSAPPPPKEETQSLPPSPTSVWVAGAWAWDGCVWSWREGRWREPPAPGMVWVPGPTIDLGSWVLRR